MPDVHDQIDWARDVEFREQELRAIVRKMKRGNRSVDRLVKVWLKSGEETWILIHVEVQSQEDTTFPLRMYECRYRVLDLFGEREIECLAVLGDPNADWRPQSYSIGFWKTTIDFNFRMVKLLDYANELDQLVLSENPFARFVAAHLLTIQTRSDLESRLEWKLRLIQGLYEMALPEEEIGQLCHDFDWLLGLPDALAEQYHIKMIEFEEEREMPHYSTAERFGRKRGLEEGREEGRGEGREEGRLLGLRELLADQLQAKFGPLSDGAQDTLNAFSDAQLKRLGQAILNANSLDELGLSD